MRRTVVVSLGGSVLSANGTLDIAYLKRFKKLLDSLVKDGMRVVLVVGGGAVCRTYLDAARKLGVRSERELDWIGIYATRINASLVKALFSTHSTDDLSYGNVKKLIAQHRVLVTGGVAPGVSSDHPTVLLAKKIGARHLVNLSNMDYVYTGDPRTSKKAQPLKDVTWDEYAAIVGRKRVPGGNYPFDPIAAAAAKKAGITVSFVNGHALSQVRKALLGKAHKGTLIHS